MYSKSSVNRLPWEPRETWVLDIVAGSQSYNLHLILQVNEIEFKPEFNPKDTLGGGRGEQTPASCSLISRYILWHMYPQIYANIYIYIN